MQKRPLWKVFLQMYLPLDICATRRYHEASGGCNLDLLYDGSIEVESDFFCLVCHSFFCKK